MNSCKKLHMIGNAHLDPVWLWNWQEGFQSVKATFRSALDRMKEYDEFIFTSSSALQYLWIEENCPEMFEEIKERVKEGRWVIVGGWWVQPDCNIPSGESFVRQGLYGQRYFLEKFGVTAKVGYNVDSFGHSGALPQILKKCGMDYYVMMRPMPNEKGIPSCLFQWESDDGSRVLVFRILYEYLSWGKELQYHMQRCGQAITDDLTEIMCFYGVGNHGGGPTRENIESIRRAQKECTDYEIVFGNPNEYFASVQEKSVQMPVVHGELQHHSVGCYAAVSEIKKNNRLTENKLITAEKFDVIAENLLGISYPKDFRDAWQKLLFQQFHDTLAGTALESAYFDARNAMGFAMEIADVNLNQALQAISWNISIDQEEEMLPLVVFNPFERDICTGIEADVYASDEDSPLVIDPQGNHIAVQYIRAKSRLMGRKRICFVGKVPALGYRVFRFYRNGAKPDKDKTIDSLVSSAYSLENERLKLNLDSEKGCIASLYDKKMEREVFAGEAAIAKVFADPYDTWAHDVTGFMDYVGSFTAERIQVLESGPVKSSLRVISKYASSEMIQDFSLYANSDKVDVKVKVRWNEKHKILKLAFPAGTIFNTNTYESAYGTVKRNSGGGEEPGLSWVDVTGVTGGIGGVYGFGIANNAKYSYSIEKNTLYITVLRSPVYAHHDPYVLDTQEDYPVIDQGISEFNYVICPHSGKWENSRLEEYAREICQPLVIIPETYHKGSLPMEQSFLKLDAQHVFLGAMKKAEDENGYIVRLYESQNQKETCKLELLFCGREIALDFKANEIKTLYIPCNSEEKIREVNMLELEINT
ncbi:MAG: glycoside hydrolase family 38 C-terminal domain-containing protein [Lachnospiraceae bacterium]|nr:glycoside hydrolase family 38 C-terminal domain-containing protein [Lachnospiraceae bacterium]